MRNKTNTLTAKRKHIEKLNCACLVLQEGIYIPEDIVCFMSSQWTAWHSFDTKGAHVLFDQTQRVALCLIMLHNLLNVVMSAEQMGILHPSCSIQVDLTQWCTLVCHANRIR